MRDVLTCLKGHAVAAHRTFFLHYASLAPPAYVMLRYVRHVKYSWRVDESWMAVERSPAVEREFERSFADEIAIDFPAVGDKVARMRHAFVASDVVIDWLRAEIHLSRRQAGAGAAVPIELPVRSTCNTCGGRGEVWGERCQACEGSGHAFHNQTLTVSVPPGVSHGARFTFSVSPPRGLRTRVEVRVAVS